MAGQLRRTHPERRNHERRRQYGYEATGGTDNLTVKASKGVVAPGTDGSMTLSITGGADVDASVSFNTGSAWTDVKLTDSYTITENEEPTTKTDEYAPVKWTLKEDGAIVNSLENTNLAAIEAYFKSASFHYDAGSTAVSLNYVLSWAWDFNGNDTYDTLLGLSMDNSTKVSSEEINGVLHTYSYATTIDFSLSVTITQID